MRFLSHTLNLQTPTYGNRNRFVLEQRAAIARGDNANDSSIATTVHIGTHIDMPYHFHDDGQTIEAFDADFWLFGTPLCLVVEPAGAVIFDELVEALKPHRGTHPDILIVKTGIGARRGEDAFWEHNYGFAPELYDHLVDYFPSVRVFGFDAISISSFQHRDIGKEAHRRFLNPEKPILILEDMDLDSVTEGSIFKRIIVSPLRIEGCDGLPCTVFAEPCDD